LLLANQAVDLAYHDTYFVVGHFHFVLSIAAAIGAFLFAIHFFCAVNSAQGGSKTLMGAVILGILGVNILFLIQHILGLEGHPRRIFLSPEIFTSFHNFANLGLPVLVAVTQIGFLRHFSPQAGTSEPQKFR